MYIKFYCWYSLLYLLYLSLHLSFSVAPTARGNLVHVLQYFMHACVTICIFKLSYIDI